MTAGEFVDADRLREEIEANAAFGAVEGEGRGRTCLVATEADRRARERLVSRMEDAGLEIKVDPVGNIAGRWTPESADPGADPVAVGSHLDSVPEGGIFDGPLGVYAGLETVRAMREAGAEPVRPVEVVSFTEEEGARFPMGCLGSAAATGDLAVEEALAIEDDEGISLGDALDGVGFRGDDEIDPGAWDAWVELHVEQATRLESAGVPVGVVTAIAGVTNGLIEIEGEANHAGSTPMPGRRDAFLAACEFALDVEAAAREVVETASDSAVGTVGSVTVEPNDRSVIPGRVELSLDARDVEAASIDAIVDAARASLQRLEIERGVDTSMACPRDVPPTPMAGRVREALHGAADASGLDAMDLHSPAAHDTMHVGAVTDAGLLFAPSEGGHSHNPLEWTDWADCARATRVLAGAVETLAS